MAEAAVSGRKGAEMLPKNSRATRLFATALQCSFQQVGKYGGFTTFAGNLISAKCEVGSAKSYRISDYPGRNALSPQMLYDFALPISHCRL